jgi:hypothetical protein
MVENLPVMVKHQVRFKEPAQQWTLEDYVNEVEHCSQRIKRLESWIEEAVEAAPALMKEVITALQALRGLAKASILRSLKSHTRHCTGFTSAICGSWRRGRKN